MADSRLLGPAEVRALAAELDLRPTKQWGQNFVIDANTVRHIVKLAGVGPHDNVVEVGPGLGSLTLGLLPVCASVTAIEIDLRLAERLPRTVSEMAPAFAERLRVVLADALQVNQLPVTPTALVANLPYNVSVPVLLHLLTAFPSINSAMVMVQAEVADRLAAPPGSKTYGVPSVKARWFGEVKRVWTVSRNVFWPVPNVDSALVQIVRHERPLAEVAQTDLFRVVDAAFGQRRKMLRSALAEWAGGADAANAVLAAAGVDPTLRGEQLDVGDFIRIAKAKGGVNA